ncbi:MAG: hypothetical protein HUU55_10845 [Myxococcales bacterium]|nr:hypothetical protein [Myxococcales bacterium]
MSGKRIALVTCLQLPEPDPDELWLATAVQNRGVAAEVCAWDDPAVPWHQMDAAVLRSTWNYPDCHSDFIRWATKVNGLTRLYNPLETVIWNSNKRYLLELFEWGFPVVPTTVVGKTQPVDGFTGWPQAEEWVVKPAISAGSRGTKRFHHTQRNETIRHIQLLQTRGDVLVQPYLKSVEERGEHAVVVIDNEVSHAVRKTARFEGDDEHVSQAVVPTAQETALAMAVLEKIGRKLPYARVDMAPDDQGNPLIMELELIEPSLFLKQCPKALERLADTLVGL